MNLEKRVSRNKIPKHIAIILDGNGRWAKKRNFPRTYGHKVGADNLKKTAINCSDLGIEVLSVYAFSTENWSRPKDEIDFLMKLPLKFEKAYKESFKEEDIKVMFSGRRDRFSEENIELLNRIEEKTKDRKGLILNVCFDYGSYTEILEATKKISQMYKDDKLKIDEIDEELFSNQLYTKGLPKLDFLIRTSGEQRLSNFLLWQAAYSELYFTNKLWPEFNKKQLLIAIENYQKRNRTYGGLKEKK